MPRQYPDGHGTRAKFTLAAIVAALLAARGVAQAVAAPVAALPATPPFSDANFAAARAAAQARGVPPDLAGLVFAAELAKTLPSQGWPARPTTPDDQPKAVGDVPVIDLSNCAAFCGGLAYPSPGLLDQACALCLVAFPNVLPIWPHNEPFSAGTQPLKRLPLAEAGFTAIPSTPLLYPRRFLTGIEITDYARLAADQSLTNDIWAGGVAPGANWTIGGVTRPILSTMHARVPPTCVLEQGWISPANAMACPASPAIDTSTDQASFPSLAAAAEAIPLPYGTAETYRAVAARQAKQAFASAAGAAQAVFDSQQTAYASVLFLKNVTRSAAPGRVAELQALYGAEWQPAWSTLAGAGDLVEVDLTYVQGMMSSRPGPAWWNVAAHGLFAARTVAVPCAASLTKAGGDAAAAKAKDAVDAAIADVKAGLTAGGDKAAKLAALMDVKADVETDVKAALAGGGCARTVLDPVAIRLSNQPASPGTALVYTPQKSETSYIVAALALRQAITQTAIWIGHVYNLHIHNVAATLALYNEVNAAEAPYYSTAPLRQILDFFADPTYVSEFHSSLFAAGYAGGPGTAVGVPDLFSLWERWAEAHNSTWYGNTVAAQLAASGLAESRFRGAGPAGSWQGLPAVAFQTKLRSITAKYAKAVIDAMYASDAAVGGDASIQAMAVTLCSAGGSNLGQLHSGGCALDTRARLAGFLGDWLALVTTHSSAHLQDYVFRILAVALQPPRLGRQTAPDPAATYSAADMLAWTPSAGTMAAQVNFFANFIATSYSLPMTNLVPSEQWQKGDVPVWGDDLPMYTGPNKAAANAAHVAFIREMTALYTDAPVAAGLRDMATNYQEPTRAPRVINI